MRAVTSVALLLALDVPARAAPRVTAFTISGGVSLAAYEAGAMYYLTAAANGSPSVLDPRVFTGTSAGSVNAFIAGMSRCRAIEHHPQRSLFWRVFEHVDIDTLFVRDRVAPDALFVRDAFEPGTALMHEAWDQGLDEGCDVLVGLTATRQRAVQLRSRQLPEVPRMTERFLVRLTGRGPGRPPLLDNHVARRTTAPRALLPLSGDDARPFDALSQVLFASTAFPVAFSAQPVLHCLSSGEESRPPDMPGPSTTSRRPKTIPRLAL